MNEFPIRSETGAVTDAVTGTPSAFGVPGGGDGAVRPAFVESGHRWRLGAVAIALALVAVGLPLLPPGDDVRLQMVIAAAALAAFVAAAFGIPATPVAVGLVTVEVVLVMWQDHALHLGAALAGIPALAACEAISLLGFWRGDGVRETSLERTHAEAALRRTALGALGAGALCLVSLIELPARGVAAALGLVGAAVLVVIAVNGRDHR